MRAKRTLAIPDQSRTADAGITGVGSSHPFGNRDRSFSPMRANLALLAVLCSATSAQAYVCARVSANGQDEGSSLSWFTRDLNFTFFATGTSDVAGDYEFDVLRASFVVWSALQLAASDSAASCGLTDTVDLTFTETPMSSVDRVGYDFLNPSATENLLVFRDSAWDSADAAVIALTTTTYDPVSGEILDADIELNSATFDFTTDGDSASMDLQNTAVHEIGHFLGLAHTQSQNSDATMYARAVPGEIKKRDLSCDDAQAVTFKYPAAKANGYCEPLRSECESCAAPDSDATTATVSVSKSSSTGDLGGCMASPPSLYAMACSLLCFVLRRRSSCDRSRSARQLPSL